MINKRKKEKINDEKRYLRWAIDSCNSNWNNVKDSWDVLEPEFKEYIGKDLFNKKETEIIILGAEVRHHCK